MRYRRGRHRRRHSYGFRRRRHHSRRRHHGRRVFIVGQRF